MKKILFLVAVLSMSACAHKKNLKKEIAAKAESSQVTTKEELGKTIHELINNSTHFTEAQKAQLSGILAANKKKAEDLSEQSYKYRAILINELLSGKKINKKEVKLLKKDIARIEDQRLKNTFDTVEKLTAIVSEHPENQQFAEQLLIIERVR